MFRIIAENTADVIIRYDSRGHRTYVSPAVREVIGLDPAHLIGGHAIDLLHPEDAATARAVIAKLGPACPSVWNIFRVKRADGAYIWIEGRYRYLTEDGGHVAVLRDITDRKRAEETVAESIRELAAANRRLEQLALQDGLTGLANRRRFDDVLLHEFARARRDMTHLGLVLVDIDYFKAYNDIYGHLAGDDCLRGVARAVQGALLRPGDLAARYGGEEIVLLLPGADHYGTIVAAQRIIAAIEALRVPHRGSPFGIVTASAGVSSLLPTDSDATPTALLFTADQALYRAKAEGRNRIRSGRPGRCPTPARQFATDHSYQRAAAR
jgi:diguanylate cyclase (GGDEF)-like protein/PAS domain S-box-containing protein